MQANVVWPSEARRPSESEWEAQRLYIEQFYTGHTLQELMEHMLRERNFKATARMYKVRLKKWSVRKNKGAREMCAVAVSGGEAASESGSKSIDASKLRRYLKRKHMTVDELIKQQIGLSERLGASSQAPRYIGAPADLKLAERMLHKIDDYVNGPFQNGQWTGVSVTSSSLSASPGWAELRADVIDLENLVFAALGVSVTDSIERASQVWAYVSKEISSVVPRHTILTYTGLCYLTQQLARYGKVEIAHAILRQLSNLTVAQAGTADSEHPLLQLYDGLLRTDPSDLGQLIPVIQLRVTDILERTLGDMHFQSVSQRALLALHTTGKRTSPTQSGDLLKKRLALEPPVDRNFMMLLMQHLQTLLNHKEYASLLEEIPYWFKYLTVHQHCFQFRESFYMHSCLAISHEMLNEPELAEKAYQQALYLARKDLLTPTVAAATYLRWFETNLRAHGRFSRIAEVGKLRHQAENSFLGHFEKLQGQQ
ncbi:MAG: hypothetical protein M1822_005907 [Bathelium mastoideum]|nr:MAG: hypothetical protein M1822_005907 [Bathelium mastoideum]